MEELDYGTIIEYMDGTYDPNFNNAQDWAFAHNTTFEELLDRRDLPKRYFQIGQPYVPTEEELKAQMLIIRDRYFAIYVDWYQSKPLLWEEMEETEKNNIKAYRQYLKDYNDQEDWWKKEPLKYDDWLNTK